jgi:hypothetical protein
VTYQFGFEMYSRKSLGAYLPFDIARLVAYRDLPTKGVSFLPVHQANKFEEVNIHW